MQNIEIKEYVKFGFYIIVLYIFYTIIGIGCPIKFLTGISCAGCGMTRAWICLFSLDIKGAFYYHPLFFLPIIYLVLFLFKNNISKKIFNYAIIIGVGLFVTIYVFRLLNPDHIVIDINIKNGLIYKLFESIIRGNFSG